MDSKVGAWRTTLASKFWDPKTVGDKLKGTVAGFHPFVNPWGKHRINTVVKVDGGREYWTPALKPLDDLLVGIQEGVTVEIELIQIKKTLHCKGDKKYFKVIRSDRVSKPEVPEEKLVQASLFDKI